VEVWQTSNLRRLRLGEEKKKKKLNKRQGDHKKLKIHHAGGRRLEKSKNSNGLTNCHVIWHDDAFRLSPLYRQEKLTEFAILQFSNRANIKNN